MKDEDYANASEILAEKTSTDNDDVVSDNDDVVLGEENE